MPADAHAHPVDVLTEDLVRLYTLGQRRLEDIITGGLHRGLDPSRLGQADQAAGDATQAYRVRQLAQARGILDELRTHGARAAALAVGRSYGAGLVSVDRVLGHTPDTAAALAGRFGRIHVGQVEVLAANLTNSLNAAADRMGSNLELVFARAGELEGALAPGGPSGLPRQFIGRRANDPYRQVALEQIAQGTVGLETRRQVSAGLARRLVADGVTDATTGFVDRAGRRWSLDRYAAMAVRTTTREAATRATATRLTEGGQDLVTISEHVHPADECTEFEGNTYSLNGITPGYDVLVEAPPFHPSCVHVMYPAAASLDDFERELGLAAAEPVTPPAARRPRPPAAPKPAPAPPAPTPRQAHETREAARQAKRAAELEAQRAAVEAAKTSSARSVADALDAKPGASIVAQRVTAAIDKVHRTRALPRIPIKLSQGRSAVGKYRFKATSGTPVDILLSTQGNTQHLTLTHEIGHFLDHQALGAAGGFASKAPDAAMGALIGALKGSAAYRGLGEWMIRTGNRRYGNYARDVRELFARSYAQYIAVRSGDKGLLSDLERSRGRTPDGPPMQWDDADFEPIAKAFDALFASLDLGA